MGTSVRGVRDYLFQFGATGGTRPFTRKPKPPEIITETRLDCSHCGRLCKTRGQLIIHQRIHSGERPFVCPTCPKSFRSHKLLKEHMKRHQDEQSTIYACDQCDERFVFPTNLLAHRLTHGEAKETAAPSA